jgi:hypothetical protein
MAQFTRTNGDYQPVVVLDAPVGNAAGTAGWNNGVNAVISGATVQPQGPKLDYFTITASGSSTFSTTQVNVIVQTIQQLATIYIYEYNDNGGSADSMGFAVYPTGSWYIDNSGPQGANSNVVLAINTALTAASVANTTTGTASATFTN